MTNNLSTMLIYSNSDKGLVRRQNQDYHRYDRDRQLMILADGVGGNAHGEIASQVAVECAYQYLKRNEGLPLDEKLSEAESVHECIAFANQKVLSQQAIKPSYHNMGTTLLVSMLVEKVLYFSWVGDSRLYYLNREQGLLQRLTRDHTLLEEGKTLSETADENDLSGLHPGSVITRMVGSMHNANPGVGTKKVTAGDIVLLCSDGLSDIVDDDLIQQLMLSSVDALADLPGALIKAAYAEGARDNVTVVVGQMP